MNYLDKLGIHAKVQAFFKPHFTVQKNTILFPYENDYEHAGPDFHRIPITEDRWTAGEPALATQLIISGSAMDAIAWLNQNHIRFRNLDALYFLVMGAVPFPMLYATLKTIHLIFSKDPTGALCDLKLASYIRNKPLKVTHHKNYYQIQFENEQFELNKLSLNALEKTTGYNFRIRTHKPKNANTFYEELRNRHLH
jgi:hypothetical protein